MLILEWSGFKKEEEEEDEGCFPKSNFTFNTVFYAFLNQLGINKFY